MSLGSLPMEFPLISTLLDAAPNVGLRAQESITREVTGMGAAPGVVGPICAQSTELNPAVARSFVATAHDRMWPFSSDGPWQVNAAGRRTCDRDAENQRLDASSSNAHTVFKLRAVPTFAAGILSFERPIPLGYAT